MGWASEAVEMGSVDCLTEGVAGGEGKVKNRGVFFTRQRFGSGGEGVERQPQGISLLCDSVNEAMLLLDFQHELPKLSHRCFLLVGQLKVVDLIFF